MLDFLTEGLDTLVLCYRYSHVIVVGDLIFYLEQEVFNNFVTVQDLINHVTFPTYERGKLLDPVLSDLIETSIFLSSWGQWTAQSTMLSCLRFN